MPYETEGPSLYPEIGRRIGAARRRAGLSQHELGRRLGVSRTSVRKLEQGLVTPDLDVLAQVARALQVPLSEIVVLYVVPKED